MRRHWIYWILGAALSTAVLVAQRGNSLEVRLQAAIQKETTEGDLKAAAEMYRRIAAQAGANRAVAAQALVRLGQCQRRLGDLEARRTFERVLKDFADQPAAAEARSLLAGLSSPRSAEATLRRVWADHQIEELRILPGGKAAVFFEYTDYEVKLIDLTTGERRQISQFGGYDKVAVDHLIPAPDGRSVALQLSFFQGRDRINEVVQLSLQGGQQRVLMRAKSAERLWLHDWSADGKFLLAQRDQRPISPARPRPAVDYGFIPVADGSWKTILKDGPYQLKARLSRDGRWFASGTEDNISLVASDGSKRVVLAPLPEGARILDWSPDGRWLVLSAERGPTRSLWRVRIEKGSMLGEPERLKIDAGTKEPLGIGSDGNLVLTESQSLMDAYTAPLDRSSLTLGGASRLAPNHPGVTRFTGWRGNDGAVSYVTHDNQLSDQGRRLVTRAPGGSESAVDIPASLSRPGLFQWSADGMNLTVVAGNRPHLARYATFDPGTGQVTEAALPEEYGKGNFWNVIPFQKANGFLTTNSLAPHGRTIALFDSATRTERTLLTAPDAWIIRGMVPSPDGGKIAFTQNMNTIVDGKPQPKGEMFLKVLDVASGAVTTLAKAHTSWYGNRRSVSWTRDGKSLVYSTESWYPDPDGGNSRIWIVPAAGGEPKQLAVLRNARTLDVEVSPDGRLVGYTRLSAYADLWVMENALPKE